MTAEGIKGDCLTPEGTKNGLQVVSDDAFDHIAALISSNRTGEAKTYAGELLSQLMADGIPLSEDEIRSFNEVCLPDLDRIIHRLKDPDLRPSLNEASNRRIITRIHRLLSQRGIHLKAA